MMRKNFFFCLILSLTFLFYFSCSKESKKEKKEAPAGLESWETAMVRERNKKPADLDKGAAAMLAGRYQEALEFYEKNMENARLLKKYPELLTYLNNASILYHKLGLYRESLKCLSEADRLMIEVNRPQNRGTILKNMSSVCCSLGQYDRALEYSHKAVEIYKKYNIYEKIADTLSFIGLIYKVQLKFDESLEYTNKALDIYEELELSPKKIESIRELGDLHARFKYYGKALKYFNEALNLAEKKDAARLIALSLWDIGYIHLILKDFRKVEEYSGRIKKAFKAAGNTTIKGRSVRDFKINYLIETKQFAAALKLIDDFKPGKSASSSTLFKHYRLKGRALKGLGKEKEAAGFFLKAVSIAEDFRSKIKGTRENFFDTRISSGTILPYRELVAVLVEREKKGEKQDERFREYGSSLGANAFYFAESIKARSLLESLAAAAGDTIGSQLPAHLREKEAQLLAQLEAEEENRLEAYTAGGTAVSSLEARIKKLKKELAQLISRLKNEYPLYAFVKYPSPLPAARLPLSDNEVLLEYTFHEDALYIFMIKKRGILKIFKIPEKKEKIEAKVNEFCKPFTRDSRTGSLRYTYFDPRRGKEIYDLLMKKVIDNLTGGESLVIIPDGILGLLPFETLVIRPGKDLQHTVFVADNWEISYYQSAAIMSLNRMLKTEKPAKMLFALGNPVYDKQDPRYIAYLKGRQGNLPSQDNLDRFAFRALSTRREWGESGEESGSDEIFFPPLPETEREIKNITALFNITPGPPDVLLNIEANETQLRSTPLKNYRYLHFATHADLPGNIRDIDEPFILLGQVENKGKDDGFFTLSEVLGLKLNAELTVLSACVTGIGTVLEGEGITSFAYAFHYAGAKSVVVSLWEVASQQTMEFMTAFYSGLRRGESKARALANARKKLRAKYANPFFWAPFILYGERY